MSTKIVSKIKVEKNNNIYIENKSEKFSSLIKKDIKFFLEEKKGTKNQTFLNILNECYSQIEAVLKNEPRWVSFTDDIFFDKDAAGYWILDKDDKKGIYKELASGCETNVVTQEINENINDPINQWKIPSEEQLKKLTGLTGKLPFKIKDGRFVFADAYLVISGNVVQGLYCSHGYLKLDHRGYSLPFLSLPAQYECSGRSLFVDFIKKGFTPIALVGHKGYQFLLAAFHITNEAFNNQTPSVIKTSASLKLNQQLELEFIDNLLEEDTIRADIAPYHQKMVEDTDLGHWSLWQDELDTSELESIELITKLVARDPKSSINDGVVGIDFGTKSTVVVYQKDNVNIHPMRVGVGDLAKEVAASHYENPTIMHFKDLERFISAYNAKQNKPNTFWKDLTISHTAHNSMLGSESNKFNTFLDEIKQWAGDKNRKLKIVGEKGKVIDLPAFLELSDDDFNPIEIYAYYLGLYINNLNNGIFMDYILSFPVTYEVPVRDKIVKSFERGLKKSLPAELGSESIDQLNVTKGASEPAAYALVALQAHEFSPEGDERIFYSVFDFGGGTTDFDFGIFRESAGKKERRFDYVIEHFGAGGDKFLGGENLLELLAFDIFKHNGNALLAKSIQFEKHPERDAFPGSEKLLSHSQEAKINTKTLSEALRPFWEEREDSTRDLSSGVMSLNLVNIQGQLLSGIELDVNEDILKDILYSRIERGVENFFDALRLAFTNSEQQLGDIDSVKIFLAGNSSQSSIVSELFEKHIELQNADMQGDENENSRFELFKPLGVNENDVEKPTGKTGVAFGLIESREGSNIKVIDHNIKEDNIRFKYYVGEQRKNIFKPLIDRSTAYNQWIEFIDAGYQKFELYYTDQPTSSTGKVSISDPNIKKKTIKLEVTDDDAFVYFRIISPTKIEYVVANENEIAKDIYLNNIQNFEL